MTIRIKKPVTFKRNQKITAKNILRYDPGYLFRNNEVGVWYDPSDLSTMFQDSNGSIPVTGMEQPVGLVLDKSRGLVLGSELVSNPGGPFTATTGWTGGNGASLSTVSEKLRVSGNNATAYPRAYTSVSTVVGKTYKLVVSASIVSGTGTGAYAIKADNTAVTTNAVYGNSTFIATATTTYVGVQADTANNVFDITSISVREVLGNHAYQTTNSARPVLSARYNLLTRTEEFDNAIWTKGGITVTANSTAAPNGAMTAELAVQNSGQSFISINSPAISLVPSLAYRFSCYMKDAGATSAVLRMSASDNNRRAEFNLSTGTVTFTGSAITATSISSVGNGWYLCSITGLANSASETMSIFPSSWGAVGNGTSGIYIWGADLRVANEASTLPPYQRVGNPTAGSSTAAGNADYDTVGFLPYLRFDGVDDSLVTSTINPGTVDKAQVFMGVRKLSDTNTGFICNFGNPYNSNFGSFTIAGPRESNVEFGGTVFAGVYNDYSIDNSTYSAPITVFNTTTMDISNDVIELRINGRLAVKTSNDSGTNNFSSYRFYVGRLEGALLPFNGRIYSLVLRFSSTNLDTNRLLNTEKWVSGKTGIPYTVNIDRVFSEILFDRSENTIEDVSNSTIVSKR